MRRRDRALSGRNECDSSLDAFWNTKRQTNERQSSNRHITPCGSLLDHQHAGDSSYLGRDSFGDRASRICGSFDSSCRLGVEVDTLSGAYPCEISLNGYAR